MSGGQSSGQGNTPLPPDLAFTLDAMKAHMTRLERVMANCSDRLERIESQSSTRQEDYDHDQEEVNMPTRQGRRRDNEPDSSLKSIKMTIPTFKGKSDPEAYLEWEKKVDLIFDCHNYSEEKKIKLAILEFVDYAIVWWDQLVLNRRRNGEPPVGSWAEMKRILRKRFVPSYFYRSIHQKLQSLKQDSRSVMITTRRWRS